MRTNKPDKVDRKHPEVARDAMEEIDAPDQGLPRLRTTSRLNSNGGGGPQDLSPPSAFSRIPGMFRHPRRLSAVRGRGCPSAACRRRSVDHARRQSLFMRRRVLLPTAGGHRGDEPGRSASDSHSRPRLV